MSFVAVALVAGGALMAASQIQQGRIAAAQGEMQEEMARRNQEALTRQAKAEMDAAKLDEKRISRRQKLAEGAEIAGAAKTGVGLAGASLNTLADTTFQFSLDRNLRLRAGLIGGQELTDRGSIIMAEGKFAKGVGKSQQTASYLAAGGSILSSVGAAGGFAGAGGKAGSTVSQTSSGPTPMARIR